VPGAGTGRARFSRGTAGGYLPLKHAWRPTSARLAARQPPKSASFLCPRSAAPPPESLASSPGAATHRHLEVRCSRSTPLPHPPDVGSVNPTLSPLLADRVQRRPHSLVAALMPLRRHWHKPIRTLGVAIRGARRARTSPASPDETMRTITGPYRGHPERSRPRVITRAGYAGSEPARCSINV